MATLTITDFYSRYMIIGPAKSGKSGEIINTILSIKKSKTYEDYEMLIVKHFKEDYEYPNYIVSFDKKRIETKEVEKPKDIEELINEDPRVKLVFIAGVNFFEDNSIVDLIKEISYSNRKVIMSGIPLTAYCEPYNYMDKLIALSHEIVQLEGICYYCSERATKSAKVNNHYESVCTVHTDFEDKPSYNPFLIDQRPFLRMIIGPMYASKTETLMDFINEVVKRKENGKKDEFVIFKPVIDKRYHNKNEKPKIKSHNFREFEAIEIENGNEIKDFLKENKKIKYVFIDEGQFIHGLYGVIKESYYSGLRITISALPRDFRGEPFGEDIPKLLTQADQIINRRAYCTHHIYNSIERPCRMPATETQRYIKEGKTIRPASYDDPVILVGGKENKDVKEFYEASCIKHHEVLNKPKPKFDIAPVEE